MRGRRLGITIRSAFGVAATLVAGGGCSATLDARAAGEVPMPMCAIDMGSNTFKRIVASFEQGRYEPISFEKKTLGVGDDLSRHGKISDAKLAEIGETLAAYEAACLAQGAKRVVAVGTAAFRDAPNGTRAVEIAAKLGIPMEIASEQRESELAYFVGSLGRDGVAVIDNGSRSIELVSKQRGAAPRYAVLGLGYRVAYQEFFASATDAGAAVRAYRDRVRQESASASFLGGQSKLVGVEFDDMVEVLFPGIATEGHVFPRAELARRLTEIEGSSPEAFAVLKERKDIDRALPRLVVAATLAEEFGYPEIELTARELGSGLIIETGLQPAH